MLKRVVSLILICAFVFALIPSFSISAKKLLANPVFPFRDVQLTKWYYSAINNCYLNGYMSGTSDNAFSPNLTLTRATFVTVLAKVSDVLLERYDSPCKMNDVKDNAWYTQSINWALEEGYAAGVGEGKFAPDDAVTREQIVLMLYVFAKNNKYDTLNIDKNALDGYTDTAMIHNWGDMKTAMCWAVSRGIISGRTSTQIVPQGTATRAELAQMITRLVSLAVERPGLDVRIEGRPISEYTIIYPEKYTATEKNAAYELKKYIYKTNGASLKVLKDTTPESECEILVGKTSRDIDIDIAGLKSEGFVIANGGKKLILYGYDDRGTIYSVYEFCEKYLGWRFYSPELEVCREDNEKINISGVYDLQNPGFEYRDVHMMRYNQQDAAVKRKVNGPFHKNIDEAYGSQISVAGGDGYYVHNLNKFYGSDSEYKNSCISPDLDNINHYMSSIEKVIGDNESDILCLSAMDSSGYWCTCSKCRTIASRYPNKYDRWMLFVNEIAARVKVNHPKMKIMTLAYLETFDYPGTVKPADNVIVMACPISESLTSKMEHPNHNRITYNMKTFAGMCNTLYVWEYPKSLSDNLAPLPSIYALIDHVRFYKSIGVKGVFFEGDLKSEVLNRAGRTIAWEYDGEFGELRAYLAAKLVWDISLTDEEIENMIVEYMQDRYGDGWKEIYYVFKLVYDRAALNGYTLDIFYSGTENTITRAYTKSEVLEMDNKYETALSKAKTREEYDNIAMSRVSNDAMLINKLWWSYKNSSYVPDRNFIIRVNERLYKAMVKYNIFPSEYSYNDVNRNETDFASRTAKDLLINGSKK